MYFRPIIGHSKDSILIYHSITPINNFIVHISVNLQENLSNDDHILGISSPTKNIASFLIHNYVIFLLLTYNFFAGNAKQIYYVILCLIVVYTVFLVIRRLYLNSLNNIYIIFNQIFMLFGCFWVIIKNTSIDNTNFTLLVAFIFICLVLIINPLGLCRSLWLFK